MLTRTIRDGITRDDIIIQIITMRFFKAFDRYYKINDDKVNWHYAMCSAAALKLCNFNGRTVFSPAPRGCAISSAIAIR